jgi:O-succinylbenzoic acid--CoA ligase
VQAALDGSGPALLTLPTGVAERDSVVAALRPDDPEAPLERDDVALVVPTSGSTGEPKGAMLTAAALRASAEATHAALGGPGRWLLALPLTHVAGLQVLVRSLIASTTPEALDLSGGFDPDAFATATARLAADRSATRRYTALVPTQLHRLLDAGTDLRAYDAVLLGGAAAAAALVTRAQAAGANVVMTYGMSETCGGCVYDGQPLDGVRAKIGADGRIRLAGPVLFAGYRLRPDLTAAALVDGWFVTGDLGRLEAVDRLTVLGRADDVIVTGGENVAIAAVEAALVEHPGIRAAAVAGVPDPRWGTRVVAVVVATDPADPPPLTDLRGWVAERAGRAAAPRAVRLVDVLPTLALGKVDRVAVGRLAAETADHAADQAAERTADEAAWRA